VDVNVLSYRAQDLIVDLYPKAEFLSEISSMQLKHEKKYLPPR
jgi:hypothetical protein